jgi:hypothetical protein
MADEPTTGLSGAWSMYRQCAATSAFHKSQLELFTKISLWLGIIGAVIGTAGHFAEHDPLTFKIVGVVGSLAVALAGVAAMQATSGGRDKIWIKCRGAGEGLKGAIYLYSASAAPFDGPNRTNVLAQFVEKVLKILEGVELRPGKMDKQPPGPLTIADYIKVRVDDQINFYTNSANKYQKKADFWRYMGLGGAAIGATIGAISAVYSLSPWVALLATVTTSVTAFVKSQRYESMIGLYQATAMRLQLLKDQWLDSHKTEADKADRDAFIQGCEQTISLENGAWMAQWSQQPHTQQKQVADSAASPAGHETVHAGETTR